MHYVRLCFLCAVLVLAGCQSLMAGDLQCVPYARGKSGIEIYGNAHTWWEKATQARYARGHKPEAGSVLVLSKTRKLEYGHVAFVKRVIDSRTIEVAHANWGKDWLGRGRIYDSMQVIDISANNDWSRVSFWSPEVNKFGFMYPASGFIYNRRLVEQASSDI